MADESRSLTTSTLEALDGLSAVGTPATAISSASSASSTLDDLLGAESDRLKALFPMPAPRAPRKSAASRGKRAAGLAAGAVLVALVTAFAADPEWGRVVHVTSAGKRAEVMLADGTRIQLDAASTLVVTQRLRTRQVQLLQGRARFSVAPSSWRPFTVDAGVARVRVLGTVFDVDRQHDRHHDRVDVAVLRGQVSVCPQGPTAGTDHGDTATQRRAVSLTVGDRVRVSVAPDGHPRLDRLPADDDGDSQSWAQGQLVFHDAPLGEVVRELQRYRSGEIRIEGASTAEWRLSGVFDSSRAEASLRLLPRILPVTVTPDTEGRLVIAPAAMTATGVTSAKKSADSR